MAQVRGEGQIRIGIVPILDGAGGGIYQYSVTMLDALPDIEPRPELVLLVERRERGSAEQWRARGYVVEDLWPSDLGWKARHLAERLTPGRRPARHPGTGPDGDGGLDGGLDGGQDGGQDGDRVELLPGLAAHLRRLGIDMLMFAAPSLIGVQAGLPYVMPVHDLQHRLHPEFPEVGAGAEWDARERLFSKGIGHAQTILVDSEAGRDDVLEFYGDLIAPERIGILPFLPASYLSAEDRPDATELRAEMDIPERYLFFPAQFWPHKNHLRVVEAIARIKARHGVEIPVVMCGSASDEVRLRIRDQALAAARDGGVSNLIKVMGYVDDRWMAPLYANARGVLLPTFFGPTNIPIIEAWSFGVPALSSDIRGIREQCGDAAVLVDPESVDSMADGIYRLWTDEPMRARLIAAGSAQLAAYGRPQFVARLGQIVTETARRLGEAPSAPGHSAPATSRAPASSTAPAGSSAEAFAHRPLVSVVIPAYNRARTIGAAIDSVRSQTLTDLEIVFVDDGSSDDTVALVRSIAEREPRLRVLVQPFNRGAQAARNTGIRAARGEWIAFLDADDTYLPDSLERRLAEARRGGFDVVHSAADALGPDGSIGRFPIPPFRGDIYRDVLLAPAPMFQTLLVKRSALRRAGFLDESVPAYQEWDTSIRLAARNKFGYVEEATFLYDLRTPGAISRDGLRGANGYERVVRSHRREIARVASLRSLGDQYRIAAMLRLRAGDRRGALRCVFTAAFFWPLSVKKTVRHLAACVRPAPPR